MIPDAQAIRDVLTTNVLVSKEFPLYFILNGLLLNEDLRKRQNKNSIHIGLTKFLYIIFMISFRSV